MLLEKCLPNPGLEPNVILKTLNSTSTALTNSTNLPSISNMDARSLEDNGQYTMDIGMQPEITPPKRGRRSEDSDSTNSSRSPIAVSKNNRWITPEKWELFKGLPKTILGQQLAGRGKLREFWENSQIVRSRHSLQMTRIQMSKYYRKEKKIKHTH